MPRKKKKYHYIYKTVNLLNGKYYLGMHSSYNLEDGYLGSGKRLKYSINKHGKENHKIEILEFVDSREELKKKEKEIVNLNEIAKKECMNLQVGGGGGFSSKEHHRKCTMAGLKSQWNDPEFIKRHKTRAGKTISIYNRITNKKGINNPFYGKHHTKETKEKISVSNKAKAFQKGEKNSQYNTCWITNGKENKKIKNTDKLPNKWRFGRTIKKKIV